MNETPGAACRGVGKVNERIPPLLLLLMFGPTHRAIELSFLIHTEVESSVHPSDADQTHCQTDELQDT